MYIEGGKMIKHLGRDLGQQFMWHVVNYSNYKAVRKFSAPVFQVPWYSILPRGGDFHDKTQSYWFSFLIFF